MWTLILTATIQFNGPAVAVTQVPGIVEQSTCVEAGNSWIKNNKLGRSQRHFSAICVRTK